MKRAVVEATGSILKELFTEGWQFHGKCKKGLPADSRFIAMTYDAKFDVFLLVFESEGFKNV